MQTTAVIGQTMGKRKTRERDPGRQYKTKPASERQPNSRTVRISLEAFEKSKALANAAGVDHGTWLSRLTSWSIFAEVSEGSCTQGTEANRG